jgi:hypothetical protein
MLSSASSAASAVILTLEIRYTALTALHKSLELGLKRILFFFGCGLTGTLLHISRFLGLLLFYSFFDRKVNAISLINADYFDFDSLSLRKMLADIAVNDPAAFAKLIETVKA